MTKPPKKTEAPVGRWRALFRRLWFPLRDGWSSVSDLRFTAGLLIVGTLLVCVVTPGRDVVATISDAWSGGWGGNRQWWWFVVAVWFLGLQAWLWSRLLIQLRHGNGAAMRRNPLLAHLPRLLGIIPYVASAIALATVPEGVGNGWQAVFLLALGGLAYLFYWQRFRIAAWLGSWRLARYWFQDPAGTLKLPRFELGLLVISLLLSIAALLWLALDPLTLPMAIGSAAVAFLAFALVIPVVNGLIALVWRERFPVLSFLVLVALGSSFLNDNHRVRTLDVPLPERRPTLEVAYRQWVAQAPPDPDRPGVVTAVLVSAAGGASRAGLWTLAALQRLDEADPDFNRRIFAISAVSGGAMGAIDYVASIAADRQNNRSVRHELAWRHAGADFLAPALGGMLYGDMAQRFIPFPLFNDRSWSMERGFEEAWAEECRRQQLAAPCEDLMRGPFLDLWNERRATWRPNLLLIGTIEEDGNRIATSNIDLVENLPDGTRRPRLPGVYDYFEVTGQQVAASTAIMNSARFPWISPAGRIVDRDGNNRAHVIDGGYFEVSAADTSEDLAAALVTIQQRLCPTPSPQCPALRIVFLTLLNGEVIETLPASTGDRSPPATVARIEPGRSIPRERLSPVWRGMPFANDVFGPLYGLFGTQSSRGERTLTRMARLESSGMSIPWAEIRLLPCRTQGERPLAMSWVLSELTRNRMRGQLAAARLQPGPVPQPRGCLSRLQSGMSHLADVLKIGVPTPTPRPAPASVTGQR